MTLTTKMLTLKPNYGQILTLHNLHITNILTFKNQHFDIQTQIWTIVDLESKILTLKTKIVDIKSKMFDKI